MHLQYVLLLIPKIVAADGRVGRIRGFVEAISSLEAINNRDTSYVQNCNDDTMTNSNSSGGFSQFNHDYSYVGTGKSEFVLFCRVLWCVQYEDSVIRITLVYLCVILPCNPHVLTFVAITSLSST